MKLTTIGIDSAKNVFQIHGADERGTAVLKKQLKRDQVVPFFANLLPCKIGMEACGSAHYWARKLQALGHSVQLIAPQYVKPFVKRNKNDAADAEAICEAVTQANQIRGLLAEFGIIIPQGISHIAKRVPEIIEDGENELPGSFRLLIQRLVDHLKVLDQQGGELEREIQAWHRENEASKKLAKIPGIGPMTASALVASVGNARSFRNGRQLAAWLGIVPKQHSTGGKATLLGISKRGDTYLRTLLIHGARAVIRVAERKPQPDAWLGKLLTRRNKNVAAVALANMNARTIWALLGHDWAYESDYRMAA